MSFQPVHLHLPNRKAFAATLAFAAASHNATPQAAVEGADTRLAMFEADIREQAGQISQDNDRQPLDRFLRPLPERVDTLLMHGTTGPKPLTGPQYIVLESVVAGFKGRISSVDCGKCAGTEPVCNGTDNDHALVARGGLCIAPILDIQKQIANVADALYARASNGEQLARTVFSTYADPELRSLGVRVNGRTRFTDSPPEHRSEVSLLTDPVLFDGPAYEAVPYVLIHEYCVHANQGVLAEVSPREHCDADDVFAEGWMDYVSFMILRNAVTRQPAAWPARCLTRAEAMHAERIDFSKAQTNQSVNIVAAYRALGEQAALGVLQVFNALYESQEEAWDEFTNFSLALNLRWNGAEIGSALQTLRSLIESDTPESFDVKRLIVDFLRTRDLAAFMVSIKALE